MRRKANNSASFGVDTKCMAEAFIAAYEKSFGHTRPNPPVGAVLYKGGRRIAAGYHRRAGEDHAEVDAIKIAKAAGESTKGAVLYVTLEPCSTVGKVGACTDAIVEAGIKRVVYGSVDPNPNNRGKAEKVLKRHGVKCEQVDNADMVMVCDRLIRGFAKHVKTGMPYVTVKMAMSLDGKICDDDGNAKWVSSPEARKITGDFRRHADVIMVGAETVRKDDPTLLPHGSTNKDLVRVVVTRSGRIPKKSKVLTDGKNLTLVYKSAGKKGKGGSLAEVLKDLGRRGYCHVLCEGGLKLATALAEEGLVDEWITVLAPKVIGLRPIDMATKVKRQLILVDDGKLDSKLNHFYF